MPTFLWEGKSSIDGKIVKGQMEASTPQNVYNKLKNNNIIPNSKKIRRQNSGLNRKIHIPAMSLSIKARVKAVFTRQFATMVNAGLPILQALEVLAKGQPNHKMKHILLDSAKRVSEGETLAMAFSNHPNAFDSLYTSMVEAGETGGVLDIVLHRLANYLEKIDKLTRQIKTAMIYPIIVVLATIFITAILLIFVIPTFTEVFEDAGYHLPLPTRIIIEISEWCTNYYSYLFGTLIVLFIGFKRTMKTDKGKSFFDPIILKIPILGTTLRKAAIARFSRTLGTMLSSGVPIIDALNICTKATSNKAVEKEVIKVKDATQEGQSMAASLENSQIFPMMVVQMIEVGESTGAIDAMLNKIADFYEDEVENAIGALKQSIEPIMIIIIGILIGGLTISMYLPIFKLGEVVSA